MIRAVEIEHVYSSACSPPLRTVLDKRVTCHQRLASIDHQRYIFDLAGVAAWQQTFVVYLLNTLNYHH